MTDEELLKRARVFDAGPPPSVNHYIFDEDDLVVSSLTVESRGDTGWAICTGRSCLNKEGEWEYESLPSERKDEFIARTRYPTPQEAFAFLMVWKAETRATLRAQSHMIPWKNRPATKES